MSPPRRLEPGQRLPAMELPTLTGNRAAPLLSQDRLAVAAVLVHDECRECRDYTGQLVARHQDIAGWDGRLVIIVAGGDGSGQWDTNDMKGALLLADPGCRLPDAGAPWPSVLIADQWGELFEVHDAGEHHDFLPPDEIVAWLRYLAIQCPECQGEAR